MLLDDLTVNAGGTVAYWVGSDEDCANFGIKGRAEYGTLIGTKKVTNGHVGTSPAIGNLTAGTYYLWAAYSGDTNNPSATSGCYPEELLTVTAQYSSVVSTNLSASSITAGGSVSDQATLSSVSEDAGGTLTYYYGSPADCTAGTGTKAGAKTVTNDQVAASATIAFPTGGTYDWWSSTPATSRTRPRRAAASR